MGDKYLFVLAQDRSIIATGRPIDFDCDWIKAGPDLGTKFQARA